jgi:hypothetical protein
VLGNINFFRACLNTVENGVAFPQALVIVDNAKALVGGLVAAVEDKSVGFQQCGWT